MAIAQFPSVVIDCPDPARLADFYAALLGWEATAEDSWVELRSEDGTNSISFQKVESGYRAPKWPSPDRPQQMHLDMVVADLDAGETEALRLGATKPEFQPGIGFRVFLDPAGHPFCLCLS